MRPDLDNFDDMNPDAAHAEPRSRAMSWLVLGVAVTGFAALAYYAYQSGTRSLSDSNILEVAAEEGAIKETPVDAGGEEFPHQDKTIYDALTGDDGQQKVEKLLPEPEEAVMPEPAVGAAAEHKSSEEPTTYVNKAVAEPEVKPDTFSAPPPNTVAVEQVIAAPVAKPLEDAEIKPVAETIAPAVAETPLPISTPPAAEVAQKPAASGAYKIQLGAYPSEQEAKKEWEKITTKHASIVRGSPIIVRAELPNGIFYRLRASGFESAASAKAACVKLNAAKQPCFYVGK